jgi:glycosyltransferase involved in cell wall biosynthesis
LRDKIRRADFIVCISTFHREFFLQEGARPEQLKLVYCGIDVDHFAPAAGGQQPSDGVLRIRSSGRLVEKKGFRYLIDACKLLVQAGVKCECVIAGSGPLEGELRSQVEHLGGGRWVTITGQALKQENIPAFMHSGDVYVLPCVWASDNDVDGLPQMLMEAMACGLPVISTHLVGIPDLIIDGQTGLLVEPNDAEQLASAIWRIGRDHALALQLATAGRQRVLDKFNLTTCLQPLIAAYRTRLERMSSTSQVPGPATA